MRLARNQTNNILGEQSYYCYTTYYHLTVK